MAACACADVGLRIRAAAQSGESWQRIKPTRSLGLGAPRHHLALSSEIHSVHATVEVAL